MRKLVERRLTPSSSPLAGGVRIALSVVAAMAVTSFLFLAYHASPVDAYGALLYEPFATLRGFGYTLVKTTPLVLIALGTILSWRSGFAYLGFEGCFVLGAAAASSLALTQEAHPWPDALFFPCVMGLSFLAGAVWSGLVGVLRTRFGGNEVLISLMANYVAILMVRYLVSGPLRAPGGLPETSRFPQSTWLPFIVPGTRAHAGIVLAIAAAVLVWLLISKLPFGYELIVTGLNPAAARYAGIAAGRRVAQAACFSGGLGALAGMAVILGEQHRLVDGIGGGIGYAGIIVALLAQLNPLLVLPTALLYAGMTVGADAMQRRAGIPSSITFILQSLIVLFVLASQLLTRYRFNLSALLPMRGADAEITPR